VRAGALGDLLLLRRTIAALRARPSTVALMAPARPASALRGDGPADVDEVWDWEAPAVATLLSSGAPPAEWVSGLSRCDEAIVYSPRDELRAAIARYVPTVISHPPDPVAAPRREGGAQHAAVWLAQPAARLGADPSEVPPSNRPSSIEQAAIADLLGRLPERFLALHAGSGARRKNWPSEDFAELASRLSSGEPFLVIEGPADAAAVAPLRALKGALVVSSLEVRSLGALLAHAGLYVGNDSGISHLAAAWGAPSLVLFGPTDPGVWRPDGERVAVLREGDDMAALSVEAVAAAALRSRAWPGPR
jgi:glycosyl transferase family 9 (putative heptosyltransferase)